MDRKIGVGKERNRPQDVRVGLILFSIAIEGLRETGRVRLKLLSN